jgi:bacillithiol system protein YtxJ
MNWTLITTEEHWNTVLQNSAIRPQLVFKHSTRCIISRTVMGRFETEWSFGPDTIQPHYLDLLQYRAISNRIAQDTQVMHQSPQVIVLHHGKVIYHDSHDSIDVAAIASSLPNA